VPGRLADIQGPAIIGQERFDDEQGNGRGDQTNDNQVGDPVIHEAFEARTHARAPAASSFHGSSCAHLEGRTLVRTASVSRVVSTLARSASLLGAGFAPVNASI
jgi:hypothetical protein